MKNELESLSNNKEKKYSIILISSIIITFIFLIWSSILCINIFIYGFDYNWAILSLEIWLYLLSFLILFMIIIDILLYYKIIISRPKKNIYEITKPQYIDGKRIFEYTYPKNSSNGVYSKTYILIDENSILKLRCIIGQSIE